MLKAIIDHIKYVLDNSVEMILEFIYIIMSVYYLIDDVLRPLYIPFPDYI